MQLNKIEMLCLPIIHQVCELSGKYRKVLIWHDLESPRGIAIDYAEGLLFWTDWGARPKIERAYMDGERRVKIVFGEYRDAQNIR